MNNSRMDEIFRISREKAANQPESTFVYDLHDAARNLYSHLPKWEKIARSFAHAIVNQKIDIEPTDRIIGRVYYAHERSAVNPDPDFDFNSRHIRRTEEADPDYAELTRYQLAVWGSPGHIAWDWNTILTSGTEGIRETCRAGLERYAGDESREEFYRCVMILLDALDTWSEMHAARLDGMGMHEEAEICRRVPKYPARNFREAVQSWFFQHIVVMKENPYGGNSPGRLDYFLWPYLERDLAEGRCTPDDARELIEELFFRIDERLYHVDIWVESVVVGGSHPDGTSAVNPLTHIMIEAFMKYDITHPHVYARIPKDAPADYLRLCADYVKNGRNRAQLLNDDGIRKALVKNGVTCEDSADYFCGGCMEIGVQGKTSDLLFTGFISIPMLLELCVTGGHCITRNTDLTGFRPAPLTDFDSFESFYRHFISQAESLLKRNLAYLDGLSAYLADTRPSFLISSMVDDCLEKGKNMHDGGTKYHDYGFSLVGIPNTADSLYAIRRAVFEDRFCTADELICALKADFVGYETLRSRLLALPKYGQENPDADAMAARLTEDLGNICRNTKNRFGGCGKMVVLTFIWAPTVGNLLGATPDGRKTGTTVAHAVTPQNMAMTEGITSAMNSCTSLPFEQFSGGASTMWDLDPAWASEEVIQALFTGFFTSGGHMFQGNITDVETLLKAQQNPDEYPGLIVRVGGYSARFTRLSKELQNEIITRVRHAR